MSRRWSLSLMGATAVAFLSSLYTADVLGSRGEVPRGTVVAGQRIGGLAVAEAERLLRESLGARAAQPLVVRAGERRDTLDRAGAGLAVDWPTTLARVAEQPTNPLTRLVALLVDREVEPATALDRPRLVAALDPLTRLVRREPTEGGVRFEGVTPVPVDPLPGRRLDPAQAAEVIERRWLDAAELELPLVEQEPATNGAQVRTALEEVARPAVAAPVSVRGDGAQVELPPEALAAALSFGADPGAPGTLVPHLDVAALTRIVRAGLADTERPGQDAGVSFAGGGPSVVPGRPGRVIDYPATLAQVAPVLIRTGPARTVEAVYRDQPVRVSTEGLADALAGGEISTFSTGGFAADSGRNIRRAAELINGKVVAAGEVFSLNAATNPRDASNGFVEAGIIQDGHPARGVGGGVSQVATTLYNAAYFAGMSDMVHKEHSYYISRYPVAREATVFDDVIDLRFRNANPGPVVIQTVWTPASLTVRILGRKTFEVTSTTGPRSASTPVPTMRLSGAACKAAKGAPGFTASDTRTVLDLRTGERRSETRTVRYRPSPTVVCGGGRDRRDRDHSDDSDDSDDSE